MNTLIINGLPRKNGDTISLLNIIKKELSGEINQIDTYYCKIKPCIDCRYCWTNSSCAIKDGMQDVFAMIDEADNIVIASPIYFSELTGSLLNFASRFQYLWVSKNVRKENVLISKKRSGIILLVGGGDGSSNNAISSATCLLHHMGAKVIETICSHNTNNISAKDDKSAIEKIKVISERILYNE